MSGFSPINIPGCVMWLDGADPNANGVAPANGATVATWTNKIAGNANWVSTGAPTYNTTLQSIVFNGAPSTFYTGNLPASYSVLSIFIVARQSSANGPIYTFNNEFGFFPNAGGTYYIANSNTGWLATTSPFSNGVTYRYSIIYDATTVSLFSAGTLIGSQGKGTLGIGSFRIGARTSDGGTNGERLTGHISEFIVFPRVLSVSERLYIEIYLGNRWFPTAAPQPPAEGAQQAQVIPMRSFLRASLFRPSTNDLLVWFDAANIGTFSLSGSTVTQWRDRSWRANHSQFVSASGVTYNATGLNGLPAVQIASGSFLQGAFATPSTNQLHAFAVVNPSAMSGNAGRVFSVAFLDVNDGDNTASASVLAFATNGTTFSPRMNNVGPNIAVTTGQPVLIQASISGSTLSSSVNGAANLTTNGINAPAAFNTIFWYIGRTTGATATGTFFTGSIGEIMVFNRPLSQQERVSIEIYLSRKWGISAQMVVQRPTPVLRTIPYSSGFLPTSVSGCSLWLDAADTTGTSMTRTGASVSAWLDKSGAAHNLSSINGASNPTLVSGQRGNGIFINGATSGYTNSSFTLPMVARTVFCVFTHISGNLVANYSQFLGFGAPAGTNVFDSSARFVYTLGGNAGQIGLLGNSLGFLTESTAAYTLGNRAFFADVGSSDTPTVRWFTNTFTRGTAASLSGRGTTSDAGIQLGRLTNSSGPTGDVFVGEIHEILVFNRTLSDSERQQIESYLANKWRLEDQIATNHPHFANPAGRSAVNTLARAPILRQVGAGYVSPIIVQFGVINGDYTITQNLAGRIFYTFVNPGIQMRIILRQTMVFELFVVGGGGGGGGNYGGGGGAGGLQLLQNIVIPAGMYSALVGSGGIGRTNHGINGSDTIFGDIICYGGGSGGSYNGTFAGGVGACGGGGAGNPFTAGAIGIQGFAGGAGGMGHGGGSGGGVAGEGPPAPNAIGGLGIQYNSISYGGGGAGGAINNSVPLIGSSGGGNGGNAPTAGRANSGGGGGGGEWGRSGQNGGSGIIILSYMPSSPNIANFVPSVFNFTGADQTYTVPAGVTLIRVVLWGAGGGGNWFGHGGAGAFIEGNFVVTPGETLTIVVGQGGRRDNGGTRAYGGGGNAGASAGSSGGGGRSAICRGAVETAANNIVVAGGGGGGRLTTGALRKGGGRGANTGAGQNGASESNATGAGNGGAANGTGGAAISGGTAGAALLGADGPTNCGGGGGGWGGGGSGSTTGTATSGGGGSSRVDQLLNVVGENSVDSFTASRSMNRYWSGGIGVGGLAGGSDGVGDLGGNGRIVIEAFW